jgi:large subunit ribosomal protein L9
VEVEKSEVKLPEGTIRELGEYEIDIQPHSDVMVTIQLSVVAE